MDGYKNKNPGITNNRNEMCWKNQVDYKREKSPKRNKFQVEALEDKTKYKQEDNVRYKQKRTDTLGCKIGKKEIVQTL